jgi:glutamate N-acetyltransferase/amino-acid N-acetyltransferase
MTSRKSHKIKKLKKKIKALKKSLRAEAPGVSPLAPKSFPKLGAIKGVRFSSAAAGVKYKGRQDVMLAEIAAGSAIAGVFTKSSTRSAPVLDCQEKLANAPVRTTELSAILVNSGNSNAFTGGAGFTSVNAITDAVSQVLECPIDNVFTASTGVIGEPLAHDRIIDCLTELSENLSPDRAMDAAAAIMTTDTFPKGATATVTIDGIEISIAGFAKGSGMIAPDMATMLVYIFTDAVIDQPDLQAMLSELNNNTFNAITVDGDTSTSDSLMLAATCQAGNPSLGADNPDFRAALAAVMQDLAHQVVRDGEGATKFIEVNVTGANDDMDARTVSMAIANSPLVKTAFAGEDPNWGRIVMAIGKSGAAADRDLLTIHFGQILVAENGWVAPSYNEDLGADYMKGQDLSVSVDLGLGTGQSTVWTCDLTHQYITINADYRS